MNEADPGVSYPHAPCERLDAAGERR